jgi:6-phospho-beta-glucosidase
MTVVGGGAFTPRLCESLATTIDQPDLELRLSARRLDRLAVLARHSAARLSPIRPGWSVRAAQSLETALEGADLVILLVRVGGLEARAWDEEFPRRFGLTGDEGLGPGGIANAWRTLPELATIARCLAQQAPAARILNLMAPLGITTRFLLDHGLDAVGVCELPLLTLESWLSRPGATPEQVTWCYAGLNHLGWFWNLRRDGHDLLPDLAADADGAGPVGPVDRITLERYGAAPLRYYYEIFDQEAGDRLGLSRPRARARQLMDLAEGLVQQFAAAPGQPAPAAESRPTPWLDRATAPIAAALLGGPAHRSFANLRNGDMIPELPPETIVEIAATYTGAGPLPVQPGPLPPAVAGFLRQAALAEELTYQAAARRDPDLVTQAIRSLALSIPESLVPELSRLARSPAFSQESR